MDALDRDHTLAILTITHRYSAFALKAMEEFNRGQDSLNLQDIFLPETLGTPEKRRESLEKLSVLENYLENYKKLYASYMVSVNSEIAAAASVLPNDRRQKEIQALAEKVESQLHEQSYFYGLRQSWIEGCRQLTTLMDEEEVALDEGQLMFDSEEAIEEMNEIIKELDRLAQEERILMQERAARMKTGASLFGVVVK